MHFRKGGINPVQNLAKLHHGQFGLTSPFKGDLDYRKTSFASGFQFLQSTTAAYRFFQGYGYHLLDFIGSLTGELGEQIDLRHVHFRKQGNVEPCQTQYAQQYQKAGKHNGGHRSVYQVLQHDRKLIGIDANVVQPFSLTDQKAR